MKETRLVITAKAPCTFSEKAMMTNGVRTPLNHTSKAAASHNQLCRRFSQLRSSIGLLAYCRDRLLCLAVQVIVEYFRHGDGVRYCFSRC